MWPCGTIVNHAPSQSSEMASEERAETLADESREQSGENIQEHLYKVLVIGDFGVGKKSRNIQLITDLCMEQNIVLLLWLCFLSLSLFMLDTNMVYLTVVFPQEK